MAVRQASMRVLPKSIEIWVPLSYDLSGSILPTLSQEGIWNQVLQ